MQRPSRHNHIPFDSEQRSAYSIFTARARTEKYTTPANARKDPLCTPRVPPCEQALPVVLAHRHKTMCHARDERTGHRVTQNARCATLTCFCDCSRPNSRTLERVSRASFSLPHLCGEGDGEGDGNGDGDGVGVEGSGVGDGSSGGSGVVEGSGCVTGAPVAGPPTLNVCTCDVPVRKSLP